MINCPNDTPLQPFRRNHADLHVFRVLRRKTFYREAAWDAFARIFCVRRCHQQRKKWRALQLHLSTPSPIREGRVSSTGGRRPRPRHSGFPSWSRFLRFFTPLLTRKASELRPTTIAFQQVRGSDGCEEHDYHHCLLRLASACLHKCVPQFPFASDLVTR